jgi:hypothetical protein
VGELVKLAGADVINRPSQTEETQDAQEGGENMKATILLKLGKEAQDVIQAWIDPEMTKGKIVEMKELGGTLWNLQAKFPEIKDHMKDFLAWVGTGVQLETMREYMTGWVEWDIEGLE